MTMPLGPVADADLEGGEATAEQVRADLGVDSRDLACLACQVVLVALHDPESKSLLGAGGPLPLAGQL